MPNELVSLDPTATVPSDRPEDRRSDGQAPPATLGAAMRTSLERSGGGLGILLAAVPTVAFVVADAVGGLTWAFVALAVAAPVTFGVRLARRESLRGPSSVWRSPRCAQRSPGSPGRRGRSSCCPP